jgi:NAD(P)-dependent dehydrogenase (short-subunit alcohol dehydrogenase family)
VATFDLTGRVAVVTGGNGGIGLGIARALASAGADVAIWARNPDKTAAATSALRAAGARAVGFTCDVTDEAQVVAAADNTVAELGRLDILVANAGGGAPEAPFLDMSLEQWHAILATNLDGAFTSLREAARRIVAGGHDGALVAVLSQAANEGAPLRSNYAAAKAGLGALVRSIAIELAPHRIRCNAIIPGWTENHRMHYSDSPGWLVQETVAAIPAGRWGQPSDIGTAAVFFADPTLTYHTGAMLVVDGGYSVMPPYLAAHELREFGEWVPGRGPRPS